MPHHVMPCHAEPGHAVPSQAVLFCTAMPHHAEPCWRRGVQHGGHSPGTPMGAPLPAGPNTLCPWQVRADHRHRPQLPVHHVIPAEPLPALVLPGRWGHMAVPLPAGMGSRAEQEQLAPSGDGPQAQDGHPRLAGAPTRLLGSREGMGCSCELSRSQPQHPASVPCHSTRAQHPAPCPSILYPIPAPHHCVPP